MPPSEAEIIEEQIHFSNVVATFEQYAPYSLAANNRRRKDLYTLPQADQALLADIGWKDKLVDIDKAIMANAAFVKQMVSNPEIFLNADLSALAEGNDGHDHNGSNTGFGHENSHSHSTSHSHCQPNHPNSPKPINPNKRYRPTDFDMDKLRSTLKQFVRDWSEEGKGERDSCYKPMIDALLDHFSGVSEEQRSNIRVLVPGAGLGRLAYEIAHLGFACQGNEFSHYMLLASYFILNRTEKINEHTIYPYVHSLSNMPDRSALLRPIMLPDALPSDLPEGSDFSLVAGDFEEIYGAEENNDRDHESQVGMWDAVLTCFFVDTAKNVINYLRVIHRILKPGGVWINLGPLLWHWENNTTNDPSIELDVEEVKTLCRKIGFQLSNERTIDTTYTNNTQAMLGYVYHTEFWTATKISDN
ncbi:N2227-domain-containing protein [Rickenella mellea]|uniref:carnosine N-methyltransferase n=1 Tax=Rickenella mellea TaxID=50990 RepID=A0A4Y7QLD4_9AGAM|nr:N2227-domain-containing protein [Rickenella mellea]